MNGSGGAAPPAERAEAVVVGAGPVGLVAAIELSRLGLKPVVLDAKEGITWSSRAICISRRSQEILDRIGAGSRFRAKALPWSRGQTFYRDRLAFRLEMPYRPDDRHAPFVNLQQFYTEQFLLETLQQLSDGPPIRWRHRVSGIAPEADRIRLTVAGPEGSYRLEAPWVVAADGGRSTVREQLGLPLHGSAYESRYLIADIEVEGADRPVERNVWFDPPSNPGSTVIVHVQPDRIWRVDYQLRDDEDADAALKDENVHRRLQAQLEMMGVDKPWRMVWKSLYKALALSLDSYRHGRVLFAGDAAHLVPIFGVRGLNSGISDAHNLGWKLAMAANGQAPQALLESYTAERRQATRENHEQAIKSTWFMSPPSAGFRLLRDAALQLATRHEWASGLINPRQSSFHVYLDSPIVQPDAEAGGVHPGVPLPNLPVAGIGRGGQDFAGGHLHDALPESGFTVIAFADAIPDTEALAGLVRAPELASLPLEFLLIAAEQSFRASTWTAPFRQVIDADGALVEHFSARRFPLYLVRPDEYVAARLSASARTSLPWALANAFSVALGRRPRAPPSPPETASPVASPEGSAANAQGLGQEGLERVFEAISQAVDASGDRGAAALLARLTLMLAEEIGDTQRVLALIRAAGQAALG